MSCCCELRKKKDAVQSDYADMDTSTSSTTITPTGAIGGHAKGIRRKLERDLAEARDDAGDGVVDAIAEVELHAGVSAPALARQRDHQVVLKVDSCNKCKDKIMSQIYHDVSGVKKVEVNDPFYTFTGDFKVDDILKATEKKRKCISVESFQEIKVEKPKPKPKDDCCCCCSCCCC
ncbi:hypothetical protein SELMODRAFT_407497 [Selaginella moellendorffii]|uniref:HMA domain-containing protein n=1 Tax=Selaginella moellendorffii TaxID=88036 RepID=D8R5T3_SELML|nr:hypothetical protein SELMODRAFT_407497 [Selaginella moellendorffii]